MKLLSFDIEISDVFELEKNEDMEKHAPFHIAVGATAIADAGQGRSACGIRLMRRVVRR